MGAYDRLKREALDPNTTPERLLELADMVPDEVLQNPALSLVSLTDPLLYTEIKTVAWADWLDEHVKALGSKCEHGHRRLFEAWARQKFMAEVPHGERRTGFDNEIMFDANTHSRPGSAIRSMLKKLGDFIAISRGVHPSYHLEGEVIAVRVHLDGYLALCDIMGVPAEAPETTLRPNRRRGRR